MRRRAGVLIFAALFAVAIYAAARNDDNSPYAIVAIVAAVVVVMVNTPMKSFPRWLQVAVWVVYLMVTGVLLFVLWVFFVGH